MSYFTAQDRAEIAKVKAYAEAHVITWPHLRQMTLGPYPDVWSRTVETEKVRIVYAIEYQSWGLAHHWSISLTDAAPMTFDEKIELLTELMLAFEVPPLKKISDLIMFVEETSPKKPTHILIPHSAIFTPKNN